MLEREANVLRFTQGYGLDLLKDIEPHAMSRQPLPKMNHPAWIIGHLAYAADGHSVYAGGKAKLSDWKQLFGKDSVLSSVPEQYPSKDELLSTWCDANQRLIDAATSADEETLGKPTQGPMGKPFPTLGGFLSFAMTGHVALHLGQLSAWRRAEGRPAPF